MRKTFIAAGAAALVLGLGTATYAAGASIPDSAGVIHGCYDKSGSLSVIDSATAACTRNQTALDWAQQGPAGPAGPAGGLSSVVVVQAIGPVPVSGGEDAVRATCPASNPYVTGGGYDLNSNGVGSDGAVVAYNGPVEESGPEGPPGPAGAWQVVVFGGASGNPLIVLAICAK